MISDRHFIQNWAYFLSRIWTFYPHVKGKPLFLFTCPCSSLKPSMNSPFGLSIMYSLVQHKIFKIGAILFLLISTCCIRFGLNCVHSNVEISSRHSKCCTIHHSTISTLSIRSWGCRHFPHSFRSSHEYLICHQRTMMAANGVIWKVPQRRMKLWALERAP